MSAALLALLLGAANAQEVPPPDDAALAQVALWLDMGELGKADALTRRAVKRDSDDPRWLRARLEVLHAAGMTGWIDAEFGDERRRIEARHVLRAWRWEMGDDEVPPDNVIGARSRRDVALLAGDVAALEAVAPSLPATEADAALLAAAALRGDARGVEAMSAAWDLRAPEGLEHAWRLPPSKANTRVLDRLGARLVEAVATLDAPGLARLGLTCLRARQVACLEAVSAALPPVSDQALMDALDAPTAEFSAFEVPPRARWGGEMLAATAEVLARRVDPSPVWARPDELRLLVDGIADRLAERGDPTGAAALRAAHLGPCDDHTADALLAAGDPTGAWRRAREALAACVGAVPVVPDLDPAAVDRRAELARYAAAWAHTATVGAAAGKADEARLAANVAAWLGGDPGHIALARRLSPGGVPGAPAVAEQVEAARWLVPASSVAEDTARLALARTAAALAPTATRLAAVATPLSACLPTMRSRCMLEAAVAAAAARAEGRTATDPSDRGAVRHAAAWWRDDEVRRFTVATALGGTLAPEATAGPPQAWVAGRPAPAWAYGLWSGAPLRGQVVVLLYAAGWCAPCGEELAAVEAMARRWRADGVEATAIAVGVDRDAASHARAARGWSLAEVPVVHAPEAVDDVGIRTLPRWHVVGPDGVVQQIHTGWAGGDAEALDALVRRLAPQPRVGGAPP